MLVTDWVAGVSGTAATPLGHERCDLCVATLQEMVDANFQAPAGEEFVVAMTIKQSFSNWYMHVEDKGLFTTTVFPKSCQHVCFVRHIIQLSDVGFVKIISI